MKQSLDPELILSCLKYGALNMLLDDNDNNYFDEKLIHPNYIKGVFTSFNEISDFWSNLVSKIRFFVQDFDSVQPPNIDTDLSELDFLGFNGMVMTKSTDLRVRDSAGGDGNVLDKIPKGTRLNIKEADGDYYKVEYLDYDENGQLVTKTGYVSREYVKENPNTNNKFETNPSSGNSGTSNLGASEGKSGVDNTPLSSSPNEMVVNTKSSNLNMRLGAGKNYQVIDTLPKGSKVNVIGKVDSNGWVKVEVNGKEGYVHSSYLK